MRKTKTKYQYKKKQAALDELRYKYNEVNSAISDNQNRITELTGKQNQLVDVTKEQTKYTLDMSQALSEAKGPAKDLQGWIEKLAIVSPFDSQGIADAYQMGLAFNFTSNNASGLEIGMEGVKKAQEQGLITNDRITVGLVDWAAAAGKTTFEIGGVMRALGQMNMTGKVTKEDLNQLTTSGLDWMGTLKKMGYNLDDVSDGVVSAEGFIKTLVETIEGDFAGAAEKQSNTWSGLLNSLGDIKKIGLREFFAGTFKAIQPYVIDFVSLFTEGNFVESIREWGTSLGQYVANGIEIVKKFISTFGEFGRILFGIGADTYDTNDAIREFLASLGFGSETINTIEGYLISLEGVLSTVRDAFGYLIDRIQGWGIGALFSAFEDGSSILGGFFERLGMSESTAEGFASVIFALKDGIIQLGTWAGQIASAVLPLLSQAFSFLMNNLSTILPILGAVVGVILAISSPVTALIGAIVLLATAWSNNWLGIQGVVSSAMAAIQPYLDQLSALLNAFITAILPPLQMAWQTLVQVWTGEVQPALAELWAALGELFTALGFGTGQTDVWSIAMGALKLILLGVIGVVQILTPAIRLGADVMTFMINQVKTAIDNFIAFKQGIDGVIATIRGLIDKVRELASSLVSLEIPDWLTPGSPTPFEMGLRGIAGAIDNLPELNIGANLAGANPVAAAAGGGGPSFGNISISVNGAGDPAAVGQAVRKEIETLFGQARR